MKVEHLRTDIEEFGDLGERGVFKLGSSSKLNYVLSDMYADRLRAWIRELLTNAVDAHREVDTDRPVDVQQPSRLRPWATIRDYGPGISPSRMSIYTTLLASTKDTDNTQNGGWGLGCKSPFAYTDTFTVETWPGDGFAYTYILHKQPNGEFAFSLTSKERDGDARGTLVKVPVRGEDVDRACTLLRIYALHAQMDVRVLGSDGRWVTYPAVPEHEKSISHGSSTLYMLPSHRGSDGLAASERSELYRIENKPHEQLAGLILVLGDVPYLLRNQPLSFGTNQNLVNSIPAALYVPVGTFSLPPSRDTLRNTIENQEALTSILNSLRDALSKMIVDMLDKTDMISMYESLEPTLTSHMPSQNVATSLIAPGCTFVIRQGNNGMEVSREMSQALPRSVCFHQYITRHSEVNIYHRITNVKSDWHQRGRMRFWEVSGKSTPTSYTWAYKVSRTQDAKRSPVLFVLDDMEKGAAVSLNEAESVDGLDPAAEPTVILIRWRDEASDKYIPLSGNMLDPAWWEQALGIRRERFRLASSIKRIPRQNAIFTTAQRIYASKIEATYVNVLRWSDERHRQPYQTVARSITLDNPHTQREFHWYVRAKRKTEPIGYTGDREQLIKFAHKVLDRDDHPWFAAPYNASLRPVLWVPDRTPLTLIATKKDAMALLFEVVGEFVREQAALWYSWGFIRKLRAEEPGRSTQYIGLETLCDVDSRIAGSISAVLGRPDHNVFPHEIERFVAYAEEGAAAQLEYTRGQQAGQLAVDRWPLYFDQHAQLDGGVWRGILESQRAVFRNATKDAREKYSPYQPKKKEGECSTGSQES